MSEAIENEPATRQALNRVILKFARPSRGKAVWQMLNTLIPYATLWALAIFAFQKDYPLWLCFIPVLVAAPVLVRIFIIFHDCCHASFLKSKRANTLVGYAAGILAFTPYRDSVKAALEGSSYYKLPKIAQWFTGNIGRHHIHHLNPSIPNYNLQACHNETQEFQHIEPLGFRKSFRSLRIHLWDEETRKLISFKAMKLIRKARRENKEKHP